MKRRTRSRLERTENRRAMSTIGRSLLLILILIAAVVYGGIPALIRLTAFISSATGKQEPASSNEAKESTLSAPMFDAMPEATPSAQIPVTGVADPGTTLLISVNGSRQTETVVPDDGQFKASIDLSEGENLVTGRLENQEGHTSPSSREWRVIRDTTPPKLAISEPADGSQRSGSKEKMLTVKGETELGASVTMNNHVVVISPQGIFSSTVQLADGANELTIIARDRAGNESTVTLTIHWTP